VNLKNNDSFRSTWKIPASDFSINHSSKILMMGSCFSENIHQKLTFHKFQSTVNPYGVIFNPNILFNGINKIIQTEESPKANLVNHDQLWHSLDHHSSFSEPKKNDCLSRINDSAKKLRAALVNANCLILTFGTAFIYKHLSSDKFVANCHKIPQSEFKKSLLNISDIISEFEKMHQLLKKINPSIKIILTVSPVRHWKDGVIKNQRSKSILHLAIGEICKNFSTVEYFPSYEIVMDDLRDYRFYKPDLLHPNQIAIDYIWEKFANIYFDQKTLDLNKTISQIQKSVHHRPQHPQSIKNKEFLLDLKAKIQILQMQHPNLDFTSELECLNV